MCSEGIYVYCTYSRRFRFRSPSVPGQKLGLDKRQRVSALRKKGEKMSDQAQQAGEQAQQGADQAQENADQAQQAGEQAQQATE